MYLPANCTSILQPLDISVNKSIKDNYRGIWEKFNCDPENNRNLIAINKNGQKLQNIE